MKFFALLGAVFGVYLLGNQGVCAGSHVELGKVNWGRDYDAALAAAKQEKKPVFLLFQEVPGCAGCQQFGAQVLSNPTLVEVIETSFVPVAIFNNRGGKDKEILQRFGEPSWNYQVVRFLNEQGKDLIPRKDRVWSVPALAARMVDALEQAKQPVPEKLRALAGKTAQSHPQPLPALVANILPLSFATTPQAKTAAFAMYCFWDGEPKLGRLDGVLTTEAGWLDGREVVKVVYDPTRLEWKRLVREAEEVNCAHRIYAPTSAEVAEADAISNRPVFLYEEKNYRIAKASDQKRVLRASALRGLTLSPEQATKVNAALRFGGWPEVQKWLTPEQRAEAAKLARR